jgi:hypothetical protein
VLITGINNGGEYIHAVNAMMVDFGMFKSQVLAYLPPEDQAHYASASVWDTIVLEVVDALRMGRP